MNHVHIETTSNNLPLIAARMEFVAATNKLDVSHSLDSVEKMFSTMKTKMEEGTFAEFIKFNGEELRLQLTHDVLSDKKILRHLSICPRKEKVSDSTRDEIRKAFFPESENVIELPSFAITKGVLQFGELIEN